MENSNSRNTDASGATRLSDQRKKVLAVILGVLALWYATYAFFNWYNIKAVKKAGDDYTAFMAAVTKADAIADPLQRCLSYPDFPGSHWNAETTRAYCEFRNHETLQPSDIEALLKQGKANEVDLAFQGYLATQRSDPKQPGLLDIAFVNAGFDDGGTMRAVLSTCGNSNHPIARSLSPQAVSPMSMPHRKHGVTVLGRIPTGIKRSKCVG